MFWDSSQETVDDDFEELRYQDRSDPKEVAIELLRRSIPLVDDTRSCRAHLSMPMVVVYSSHVEQRPEVRSVSYAPPKRGL